MIEYFILAICAVILVMLVWMAPKLYRLHGIGQVIGKYYPDDFAKLRRVADDTTRMRVDVERIERSLRD